MKRMEPIWTRLALFLVMSAVSVHEVPDPVADLDGDSQGG